MHRVATFVSLLFNPTVFLLIMPFLIVYTYTESEFYALKWQLFTSVFIFLSVVFLIVGRIRGVFSDFDLSRREERNNFYFFALILAGIYLFLAFLFKGIFFPMSIVAFGIVLGIVVFGNINQYIKASIHTASVCAFVLAVGFLYGFYAFFLSFAIIPLVIWSRLVLKKHTPLEIVVGAIAGVGITLLTFFLGKYFLTV